MEFHTSINVIAIVSFTPNWRNMIAIYNGTFIFAHTCVQKGYYVGYIDAAPVSDRRKQPNSY